MFEHINFDLHTREELLYTYGQIREIFDEIDAETDFEEKVMRTNAFIKLFEVFCASVDPRYSDDVIFCIQRSAILDRIKGVLLDDPLHDMSSLGGGIGNTDRMALFTYDLIMERDPHSEIAAFELFVNPKSFEQTVENAYFIAHLVKDKKITVRSDPGGGLFLQIVHPSDTRSSGKAPEFLSRYDMSPSIWQSYVEKQGIT